MSPTYVQVQLEGVCESKCMSHAQCVFAWEELSGPDRVSLHDKQLLRAGMRAGQSGK